jgi:hypothetical protein
MEPIPPIVRFGRREYGGKREQEGKGENRRGEQEREGERTGGKGGEQEGRKKRSWPFTQTHLALNM